MKHTQLTKRGSTMTEKAKKVEDIKAQMKRLEQENVEEGQKEIDEILKARGLILVPRTVLHGAQIVEAGVMVVKGVPG